MTKETILTNRTTKLIISREILSIIIREAAKYSDASAFASDLAHSSIWENNDIDFPTEQICSALADFWKILNTPVKSIIKSAGMSQAYFAQLYNIPIHTLDHWCSNPSTTHATKIAPYLKYLIIETLGLFPFDVE